jgi:hypothetical protein
LFGATRFDQRVPSIRRHSGYRNEQTADGARLAVCKRVERQLACRYESVPQARRVVAETLDEWGAVGDDPARRLVDDVLLVATELIANAVRACYKRIVLVLEVHREWVEVAVSDDSPYPAVERHVEPDATGGRGVAIVAALSNQWGQTSFDGSSKVVWSRLHLPHGSVIAAGCHL